MGRILSGVSGRSPEIVLWCEKPEGRRAPHGLQPFARRAAVRRRHFPHPPLRDKGNTERIWRSDLAQRDPRSNTIQDRNLCRLDPR